jgi:hypothetical protein
MDPRTEYLEKLSAQIVEWDVHIDLLKDKAKSLSPESEHGYSDAITSLQLKRDKAAIELQGISSASDDEWVNIKTGADDTMGEVRSILYDAITKTT